MSLDPRDPFDPSLLVTYVWVLLVSLMGGLANFLKKVREGRSRPFNIAEFVGELVVSASAGLITFWLARAAGLNPWVEAALVGISGHMGARALFQLEKHLERWIGKQ